MNGLSESRVFRRGIFIFSGKIIDICRLLRIMKLYPSYVNYETLDWRDAQMPRPRKRRRVCCLPENARFGPLGIDRQNPPCITMSVDEYETIRLIDLVGCTQEECAKQMNVARTTVQGIYDQARKKIAESLVHGKALHIEGGEYRLCSGSETYCGGSGCQRRLRGHAPTNNDIKSLDEGR
jgi:uncharacterized protein